MSSILLIQSDPAAAERTRQMLQEADGIEVAACASTLAQATTYLARHTPDLLLAELRFDDGPVTGLLDGLSLGGANRPVAVVIASAPRDPMLMDAVRHGAAGHVINGHPPQTLIATLRAVLDGESPMSPEIAGEIRAYFESQAFDDTDFVGETQNPMHLGESDRQLLERVEAGQALATIAAGLYTTPHLLGVQLRALCLRMQFGVRADSLSLSLV